MDDFLKYFDDKKFVRWVLNPTDELNKYWENYRLENPSEKKEIEMARALISHLQSKKESIDKEIGLLLSADFIKKLEVAQKRTSIKNIAFPLLKYAAVGFLFFSLGLSVYYFKKPDPFSRISEQLTIVQDPNNAQLILSNGKNVSISKTESEIEYKHDGQIVINGLDTLIATSSDNELELNQLVVPYGKTSSIKLPDGTFAFLNAGSRLVYPSYFEGNKREVYLFGEGYFEVAHNPKVPFIVKTNELEVEAVGTKFNLSAYHSDGAIETVLVDGIVRLHKPGFQFLSSDITLLPNQRAEFNRKTTEITIKNVDVENYVSWHQGLLIFESADLNRIVKRLERYYNIQIRFDEPMLGMKSITGKLKLKEEKESVLSILANSAAVELIKINPSLYILK